MAKKEVTYAEAMGEIEKILARLRNEEMDVDSLAAEVKRVKGNIDIAAANGIKKMRHDIAWGFFPEYEGIQTWQSAVRYVAPAIREVSEYAASKGVTNCSENHGRLFQDSDRMLALFDAVNHPNYRWLCDIGNFGGVDEDCATAVSKLLPFLTHVHAKDSFWRSGMSARRSPLRVHG